MPVYRKTPESLGIDEKQESKVAREKEWWKVAWIPGRPGCDGKNPMCPMNYRNRGIDVPAGALIKIDLDATHGIMLCERCLHGVDKVENPWCIRVRRYS